MTVSVIRTQSALDYGHTGERLHKRVNFDTPEITKAARVYVGVLPAFAHPEHVTVRINSTFNQGIIVGTSADDDAFVAAGDVTEGTTGVYVSDRCASAALSTVDLPVYVQTSTASTSGQADVWLKFLPAK